MQNSKTTRTAYWIFTLLFCLQIGFTAFAQLRIPEVAQEFARLGFPNYFRIELLWMKFLGVATLLIPRVSARLKEWAFAGFTICLVSAMIAHFACGDGPEKWSWSAGTLALEMIAYYFFRKLETLHRKSPTP